MVSLPFPIICCYKRVPQLWMGSNFQISNQESVFIFQSLTSLVTRRVGGSDGMRPGVSSSTSFGETTIRGWSGVAKGSYFLFLIVIRAVGKRSVFLESF